MGQSSSTQRDHRRSLSDHLLFRTAHGRENRYEAMSNRRHIDQTGEAGSPSGTEIFNDYIQIAPSDQPGAAAELPGQSTFSESWRTSHLGNTREENRSVFDLGHQQDYQDYRSATFARMTARRQSTMSRLGSRILPNSVIRGLLSSEEETPAEGHAHRHGVSRSTPRSEVAHSSSRFSPFSSLSSRGITRRRSLRAPYFIPRSDPTLVPDTSTPSVYPDPASERARESNRGSWRRSARLHRVRRSLSNPLSQMFGQPSTGTSSPNTEGTVRPTSLSDGHYPVFRPSTELDNRMDFDEAHEAHELDSVEPAVRHTRPDSPASNQSAQGVTNARQVPSFLRAQPSRVLRREEQMPMSRVLQLAAAAIAAQLSGSTSPVLPNIQALGNDGLNGSLENFIQSLHNATSTQANPSDAPNPAGESGPSPPLNFLRVFRFANSDPARASDATNRSSTGSDNANNQPGGMDVDNQPEGTEAEGRTVTLVVVGVRLVPASNGPSSDQPNPGHDLDALLRMPFLSPGIRNPDGGSSRPDTASRLFPNRLSRGPSTLSTNDDTIQPGSLYIPHRLSGAGTGSPLSSLPNSSPASPPGPHPPPSTPAEPGLSTSASGASTPSRRPSSASAMSPSALPQVHEDQSMQPSVETAEEHAPLNTARQRRRSDSEYARHRGLGAGSNRRNGVVEPDNATPPVGRSWLIYVVGANVSENNLAFATPSLFTDVRSLPIKI